MEVLNESQPVSEEEAAYVRQMALHLGASEDRATLVQMRKALAPWYINVERGETSGAQLAMQAVSDVRHKLAHAESLSEITPLALLFSFVAQPLFALLIASYFGSPYQCEHPHLANLLWWSGVFTLVFAACWLCTWIAYYKDIERLKSVSVALARAVTIVVMLLELFGVSHV